MVSSNWDLNNNTLTFLKDSSNGGNGVHLDFTNANILPSQYIFKATSQNEVLGFRCFFEIGGFGQVTMRGSDSSYVFGILEDRSSDPVFQVGRRGGGLWQGADVTIGNSSGNSWTIMKNSGGAEFRKTSGIVHRIRTAGGGERVSFFSDGSIGGRYFGINTDAQIASERIGLNASVLISDQFVQHVSTTPTVDGDLINNSLSFHINGANELSGRYKDNAGGVQDVKFTNGLTETLTFGGGSTGDIATLTVTDGLITAKTLVL
jgi:hypothetical protein